MIVLGLISGTSHDGIDGAAVELRADGDLLRARLLASATTPYAERLRERLVAALPPAKAGVEELCRLDVEIGDAFAAAARGLVEQLPAGSDPALVCSHGQTVFHGVEGGVAWGTLQVGQPARIAEATGLPVVADLRARDIAAGGQGAPLVAILDQLALADSTEDGRTAALNLGGIANVTVTDARGSLVSYDIGPANALIDAAMVATSDGRHAYDAAGATAGAGDVDLDLLERLLDEPYYALPAPKSTGKELFNGAYLAERAGGVTGPDLVATATALTVEVVSLELRRLGATRVLVAGGGVHNETLMGGLAAELPRVELLTSDAIGLPPDAKEAVAFALLGWLSVHGLTGSVPSATGARGARVLGALTPGRRPLALPGPVAMPARLRMEGP